MLEAGRSLFCFFFKGLKCLKCFFFLNKISIIFFLGDSLGFLFADLLIAVLLFKCFSMGFLRVWGSFDDLLKLSHQSVFQRFICHPFSNVFLRFKQGKGFIYIYICSFF